MSEWGKLYGKMYEGSMVGKGFAVFALMPYVISKMKCEWVGEGKVKVITTATITLNTTILAAIFGEPEEKIEKAIEILCSPDPKTSTEGEEGRRLVKIGQFDYRVVNAKVYQNQKDKEAQREKARERQQRWREKHNNGIPLPGEVTYVKGVNAGLIDAETGNRM